MRKMTTCDLFLALNNRLKTVGLICVVSSTNSTRSGHPISEHISVRKIGPDYLRATKWVYRSEVGLGSWKIKRGGFNTIRRSYLRTELQEIALQFLNENILT